MTSKLVTHKDIHAYMHDTGRPISIQTVIVWGAAGVFGDLVIPFPKHYKEGPALKAAVEKWDSRFKLTDKEVADVLRRVDAGESQASVAEDYDVDPSLISLIVSGKRRKGMS